MSNLFFENNNYVNFWERKVRIVPLEEDREAGYLYYKVKENNLNIYHQPSFFDALQLIQPQEDKSYQRVPLGKNTSLMFQYTKDFERKSIQYDFDFINGQIAIKDTADKQTYQLLSCFVIKEGCRVTYLTQKPNTPLHAKIKKQPPRLISYARPGD